MTARQRPISSCLSKRQDGITRREELRNLADDASIDEMTSADLFCIIYVNGVKDNALREKLLEVQDPNIEKFDRVVDAYDQAKKQLADMKRPAAASAASRGKNTRTDARPPRSQSAAGGGNTSQSVSREEVKRREMLHGKCFRCGRPDHMITRCAAYAGRRGIPRGHAPKTPPTLPPASKTAR